MTFEVRYRTQAGRDRYHHIEAENENAAIHAITKMQGDTGNPVYGSVYVQAVPPLKPPEERRPEDTDPQTGQGVDIKARAVALEIIAILTGYRNGKCDPDHNRVHTLHSIAAGESTFAAIDLAMTIARPIRVAIDEAVAEGTIRDVKSAAPPRAPNQKAANCD